jgi:hypothetical protein
MKRKIAPVGLILLSLAAYGMARIVSSGAPDARVAAARAGIAAESDPERIREYKRWTRVHTTPLPLPVPLAGLCAAPSLQQSVETASNPHRQKYFTVYVNDAGREAMMAQLKPAFPVGSIIVKEKLTTKESATPELLTVMIKREKGFNPPSGDWEYLVTNGEGAEIEWRGKRGSCSSCHALKAETDYVFRSYLPDEAKSALH